MRRTPLALTLLTLVAVAAAIPACAGPAPPPSPPLILIVVDTVRADHMGTYGYERPTTPRLDEIAAEGAVFEWGFTTAAFTLPAMTSILTGRLPTGHGAGRHPRRERRFTRLREEVPTLAELLAEAGYTTGAVANGGYLRPGFELDRGFEHYDFHPATDEAIRRADDSVDLALDWIDERDADDEPFFLMLHLFDAHRHYDAPEPARGAFTGQFADAYEGMDGLASRLEAEARGDLDFALAAYDEEILWVDMQVGRLVEGLRERGLWGEALVGLTSDHGEAFREHGWIAHGTTLHNEVMRVPLMLWGPGVPPGRRPGPVSVVDLAPTFLDAADVEVPGAVTGASLLPHLAGVELPDRLLFAENDLLVGHHAAVVSWPLKLIHDFDHETSSLFDLERDPQERIDLTASPDRALRRTMRALRRQARELYRGQPGEEVELDPEVTEELRALGYIQ